MPPPATTRIPRVTGFRKIPNVYTSSDPKLTNTPTPEAIATRHPG